VNPNALLAIGPVPVSGKDKTFPGAFGAGGSGGVGGGFKMYAEKAPNARGVRRVLEKVGGAAAGGRKPLEYDALLATLQMDAAIDAIVMTGNYPSDWVTPQLLAALDASKNRFVALIDTLSTKLADRADVVIPSATWAEKSGTFENASNRLQAFERAISPIDFCKSEAQIALDVMAVRASVSSVAYDAATTRREMGEAGMPEFVKDVHLPTAHEEVLSDMQLVQL
jgi:NADH-quinone oxidoreductase subunit G